MSGKTWHNSEISSKRFLVTGGAGFIGSHLVDYLMTNGAKEVRVLDDVSTGFIQNIERFLDEKNFKFIRESITDLSSCKKACDGIDIVLHHAALGSVPRSIDDPISTHNVNATGFLNMLVAAKEMKMKKFIYASSSSVYGDNEDEIKTEERVGKALSPYAVTKKLNEQYGKVFADVYGMDITGLRYFNIFGPRQSPTGAYAAAIPLFIDGLLNNKPVFINGDGSQSRDFTFVENVVQANMKACGMENGNGEVFNIAAGGSISVREVFELLKKITGSNVEVQHREGRKGEIRNSRADISKAKKAFGYSPEVNVEEGLVQTVETHRNASR
ncbi:MAG TPA: SDR family oxidoreductase [Bacteroidia bacterium]|jgi:UDP-N-acetylglucosamine 4-epimerase|nr:SDR family oxidoreductase [Bacteroidia bacterium]